MKKILSKVILSISFIVSSITVYSQTSGVSISSTNSPPDPSAGIDVNFSNKGALIPRLTTTQRDAIPNPALGLFIFNTTTNCFNVWIGNAWKQWCGECDFTPPVVGNNSPLCVG